ncbi:glycosyltransferase family 4 protein [Acinetobacter nectaris]|uniref:glycosyltransferase family 4 protein n=1 Tax=Acinetobacter nectaris TaxID=1219382 RepID=UPI001F39B884|nr:glycosyltransferase family 4 protein [Acinetobacter nectaris]
MKKIGFFISNLNHSGGTERVTSLIANQFAKSGFSVVIISLSGGDEPFFELDPSINICSLYSQKVSFKKHFIDCIRKLRSMIKKEQLTSLVVVDSILCVFSVPALSFLKVKHICWEHFNFNVDLGVKMRSIGRKLAAQYCTTIVTLTNKDKQLWEKGISNIKADIIVIPNPLPYQTIDHRPNLSNKIVLAVGRLTYQKGFDLLLSAWSNVCKTDKEWRLKIVGSGEDEQKLKQQAIDLNIVHRVEFIPATKNIEKYYKEASFFCMSSRFEGFGMVLIEAQSFGLPIVSFDCDCGPSDIIKDNINGLLVNSLNGYDLYKNIMKIIDIDKMKYEKFCSEAKENTRNYSINYVFNDWSVLI